MGPGRGPPGKGSSASKKPMKMHGALTFCGLGAQRNACRIVSPAQTPVGRHSHQACTAVRKSGVLRGHNLLGSQT